MRVILSAVRRPVQIRGDVFVAGVSGGRAVRLRLSERGERRQVEGSVCQLPAQGIHLRISVDRFLLRVHYILFECWTPFDPTDTIVNCRAICVHHGLYAFSGSIEFVVVSEEHNICDISERSDTFYTLHLMDIYQWLIRYKYDGIESFYLEVRTRLWILCIRGRGKRRGAVRLCLSLNLGWTYLAFCSRRKVFR